MMESALFGVSSHDPATYIATCALVLAIAVAPALRHLARVLHGREGQHRHGEVGGRLEDLRDVRDATAPGGECDGLAGTDDARVDAPGKPLPFDGAGPDLVSGAEAGQGGCGLTWTRATVCAN